LAGCRPEETTTAERPTTEPSATQPTAQPAANSSAAACAASPLWATNPNPPGDVPKNALNCQFHQFSWQWFMKLVSPLQSGSNQRVFEDKTQYPVLGVDLCPGAELTSSIQLPPESRGLGIRIHKQQGPAPFPFILPEDIDQAGSNQPLYDRNGKVVYYNAQYTPNECGLKQGIDSGFPANVTELKLSWRQIDPVEAGRYYTIQATIQGSSGSQQVLLGLVGFHIVKNTPNHPEFLWASFEHVDNAPDCDGTSTPPASGWSFTSAECAACLNNPYAGNCGNFLIDTCRFNVYQDPSQGKKTNICRAIPNGGGSLENQTNIEGLNAQMASILSSLPPGSPMSVFRNYFLAGTLWIKNPNSPIGPWLQDGSTTLLNTTMESYDQLGGPNTTAANCFSCHNFNGAENTTAISHILPIPSAQKRIGGAAQAKK
jgi:hypothetical protein